MDDASGGSPPPGFDNEAADSPPHPPVNLDLQCAVTTVFGRHKGRRCVNRLSCGTHSLDQKRAVKGRSASFDELNARQPANLAHMVSGNVNIVDPDKHCAVLSAEGRPCMRLLNCGLHSVEEKEQIQGRSLSFSDLLAIFTASNTRKSSGTINVKTQCAVVTSAGEKCTNDLRCPVHTRAQKLRISRGRPFDDLMLLQLRQTLLSFQGSIGYDLSGAVVDGYGLAVAAVDSRAHGAAGPIRKRYRRQGLQKASVNTHEHGEVAEPEFKELQPAGTNLENVRQMLYEYDNSSSKRDVNDTLQQSPQQTINEAWTKLFDERDQFHFCFTSRADMLRKTAAATSKRIANGGDKNACIISAPKKLFLLDVPGARIILKRLRQLLERLKDPLGYLPDKLKHLFLVHALFMSPESDDVLPKLPLPVREETVDGKPALTIETTQLDPDTSEPYETGIAIPVHETLRAPTDDEPPDWFDYPGFETSCESLNLSGDQANLRSSLAKRLAYHIQLGIIRPRHLRWLLARLSAMYDVSLLVKPLTGEARRVQLKQRLAVYDNVTGVFQPSPEVGILAPYLPAIQVQGKKAAFLVEQCLNCRFLHSKDIVLSWADACNAADLQRSYGVMTFAGPCQCTPDQAKTEFHDCRACGATTMALP